MRPITRSASVAATALGAGALLALAAPVAAQAHVNVTPGSTAAGSYTVLEFASGHGCDGSPTTSNEETKARLPLKQAKIEVIPDEENPGYYKGKFMFVPHYQLEGMDVALSMVSRLPKTSG